MIVFIVVILAMIGVFSLRLYKTQAAVTEDSLVAADADSMEYQSTVEAARGNILDRNGNVLVSNRASYNLVIINFVFFNAPDPNGNLLKVLNLCDELGIAYESHFPVTSDRPYEYTDDNDTDDQRGEGSHAVTASGDTHAPGQQSVHGGGSVWSAAENPDENKTEEAT